jgi:hypothetical protein
MKCAGMFTAYRGTKFHMVSSNGSLVTSINLKTKKNFQFQVQQNICLRTLALIFQDINIIRI